MKTITHSFVFEGESQRLDRFLAEAMDVPRNQIQRWIGEGRVEVGGAVASRPARSLTSQERVTCHQPVIVEDPRVSPEEGPLQVLFEDPHIVVIDKPADLVVHPGAGHDSGTLAHRLLSHYPEMVSVGGQGRPGIVHRLDRGTSGVMVLARTAKAYLALSNAFAERRVSKTYIAIAYGPFQELSGRIESPIGRHPHRRKEMSVLPNGRPSLTQYKVLDQGSGIAALEVDLGTGRTHQIRVHLKSIGHPLVGDPTYGERRWKTQKGRAQATLKRFPRPALHSWRLGLRHPLDDQEMKFQATVPEDLEKLWGDVTERRWPVSPVES